MNFLTVGARLNKQLYKLQRQYETTFSPEEAKALAERYVWGEYEQNVRTGLEAMKRFKEIAGIVDGRWYFISIRPPTGNFQAFYTAIAQTLQRKCFLEYRASFEQKGVTESTLGEGYHVHLVANMSQRSKGEVIRDLKSSLKLGDEAIDVKPTKNPHDLFQRYCLEYKSDDEHKETTQAWDAMWREREGLRTSYENDMPVLRTRVESLT